MSGLSGRTLTIAAAVVFGLALFGVLMSIHPIADFNTKGTAERLIPVFEAGDEEPAVNQSEDDTPKPVLLPASTETPPSESIVMATDPLASEAVEFVLQKPSAEATSLPSEPIVPAAKSPWFESPPAPFDMPTSTEETSAQSPQPLPDLVTDTGTSAQPLPPDLSAEAGAPPQPPPASLDESSEETTSSPDLPADTSPLAEDRAYLE